MAAWGPACDVCYSNDCPGCDTEPEGNDASDLPLGTLDTPEAKDWTPIPGWQEEGE